MLLKRHKKLELFLSVFFEHLFLLAITIANWPINEIKYWF